jgi:hypothetical protein
MPRRDSQHRTPGGCEKRQRLGVPAMAMDDLGLSQFPPQSQHASQSSYVESVLAGAARERRVRRTYNPLCVPAFAERPREEQQSLLSPTERASSIKVGYGECASDNRILASHSV